jgi:hypothetical protein
MPIPETTSAESFARFVGGRCLRVGDGKAWREIKAWTVALPPVVNSLPLPSVSEPFLAWTTSGDIEFQEHEGNHPSFRAVIPPGNRPFSQRLSPAKMISIKYAKRKIGNQIIASCLLKVGLFIFLP